MSRTVCPSCGQSPPENANFCNYCMYDLRERERVIQVAGGVRWKRMPDEVAVRVESADLHAWFGKGLIIEEGTRGLLFDNGKNVEELGPGRHTVENITDRLKNLIRTPPFSAVLFDVGEIPLNLTHSGLVTSDSQQVGCRVQLAISVLRPREFFVNFMKGSRLVSVGQLRAALDPMLLQVLKGRLHTCAASELSAPSASLQDDFRDAIANALDRWLCACGLRLLRIDLLELDNSQHEALLKVTSTWSQERTLQRLRQDHDREKVELNRRWDAFQRQLETEDAKDRMSKLENDAALKTFSATLEHEAKVGEIVRRDRLNDCVRDSDQRKQDAESQRRHLVAELDWQRKTATLQSEHAYKKEVIALYLQLSDMERAAQLKQEDEDHQRRLRQGYDELQDRLKREGLESDHDRLQDTKNLDAELKEQTARASTTLSIETDIFDEEHRRRQAEHQQDQQEICDGIAVYQQLQQMKQEKRRSQQTLEQDRLAADHERQLALREAAHRHTLGEWDAKGKMNVESLIVTSPAEQAQILAGQQQTKSLKDFSADQILAMAAEKSPQVAQAFEEKFRAMAGQNDVVRQREKEMFEEMLDKQKQASDQLAQHYATTAQNQHKLAVEALQTQKDVGVAAAVGSKTAQSDLMEVLVKLATGYDRSTGQHVPNTAPILCPQCRSNRPPASNACSACGCAFSK